MIPLWNSAIKSDAHPALRSLNEDQGHGRDAAAAAAATLVPTERRGNQKPEPRLLPTLIFSLVFPPPRCAHPLLSPLQGPVANEQESLVIFVTV